MKKGLINIHIITTNDINGALMSENNEPDILRAATFIKMIKKSSHNVLLFDNGNALIGSSFMYYFSQLDDYVRNPMITVMNAMHYDASGISPGEFKYGVTPFNQAQAMSSFPFLSANIISKSTKEPFFNTPYIIKNIQGIKIGIIGITSKQLTSILRVDAGADVTVEDPIASAKMWIRFLHEKENPDFVIALYNGDLKQNDRTDQQNKEIEDIIKAAEGIDILITGQSSGMKERKVNDTIVVPTATSIDHLCHIELNFKERTNTFELVKEHVKMIDLSVYPKDEEINEMLHYEYLAYDQWRKEKLFKENQRKEPFNMQQIYKDTLMHIYESDAVLCKKSFNIITNEDISHNEFYKPGDEVVFPVRIELNYEQFKKLTKIKDETLVCLYQDEPVKNEQDLYYVTSTDDICREHAQLIPEDVCIKKAKKPLMKYILQHMNI